MAADKPAVQEAQALESADPRKAEAIYKEIISKTPSVNSDDAIKEYETALLRLGGLYRDAKSVPSPSYITRYTPW
jgi:26S proteasome regulatory subunit N6